MFDESKYLSREKFIRRSSSLSGKTIKETHEGYGTLALLFTDGTYTVVEASGGDCENDPDIGLEIPSIDDLYHLGVVPTEEYEEYIKEQNNKRLEGERRQYEKLKKKFEPNL